MADEKSLPDDIEVINVDCELMKNDVEKDSSCEESSVVCSSNSAEESQSSTENVETTIVVEDTESDSDGECTLAVLAKSAKAQKLKEEALKIGAKPLTVLFTTGTTDQNEQSSPQELDERAKRAIELRRQAEEKRAEERRQREEEKLTKQLEMEKLKAEKEEQKRIALEKKAEEKRIKEEERLKKEEERLRKEEEKLQKLRDLENQREGIKKMTEEVKKMTDEKRLEEKRKREELREAERKKKEEERLQKLKEMEKAKQERDEAKRLADEEKKRVEEEKKRAEEREQLKREKQKQFFGNFFKSPAALSSNGTPPRTSLTGSDMNKSLTGENQTEEEDIVELLPNGQPKPPSDEMAKKSLFRCYIGPFVAFEPLPGMRMMPHKTTRSQPFNVEQFDNACANQDATVSIRTVFGEKKRKQITKHNIHELIAAASVVSGGDQSGSMTDGGGGGIPPASSLNSSSKTKEEREPPELKIIMNKDGSFVGYLRETIAATGEESTTATTSTIATNDQKKHKDEKVSGTENKEMKSQNDYLKSNDDKEVNKDIMIIEETVDLEMGSNSAELGHQQPPFSASDDDDEDVILLGKGVAAKGCGRPSVVVEDLTVEDSIMEIDEPSNDGKKQEVAQEKYEIHKMYFKDLKELDMFLFQPTNSGSRKFVTKSKYIRIRHNQEDKSWLDYFGTWRKLPPCQLNRHPLKKLTKFFDYNEEDDFFSDTEEQGESVDDSGDEVASQSENEYDYEDEDGFLVPHGYLSEEEGGEGQEADTENLKKQTKEWEARFKKKCVKMIPRLIGPFYGSSEEKPAELLQFSAVFLCDTSAPIQVFSTDDEQSRASKDKFAKKKLGEGENIVTVVPKAAMPNLIRLIHGNTKGLKVLVEEFRAFWLKETATLENPTGDNLSKKKLEIKILSMADREKREKEYPKVCWYVTKEVLKQYRLTKLPVPNPSCLLTASSKDVSSSEDVATSNKNSKPALRNSQLSNASTEPPNKRVKLAAN